MLQGDTTVLHRLSKYTTQGRKGNKIWLNSYLVKVIAAHQLAITRVCMLTLNASWLTNQGAITNKRVQPWRNMFWSRATAEHISMIYKCNLGN